MNRGDFRLQLDLPDAQTRFRDWFDGEELQALIPVESASAALELALDDRGRWRGSALFVYQQGAWTVFEDLSGGFSWIPAAEWLRFTVNDDLVVASYNDSIPCAEWVVIRQGKVLREFTDVSDSGEERTNEGHSPIEEGPKPFSTWIDVAGFVDEDDHLASERGLLRLIGKARGPSDP